MTKQRLDEFEGFKTAFIDTFGERPDALAIMKENTALIIQSNINLFKTPYPDFQNMTIKEKTPFGWLRAMFIAQENIINGRWNYWTDIIYTQEVENKPIPKLNFINPGDSKFKYGQDMIKNCLSVFNRNGNGYKALELFADWILYGLGSSLVKTLPSEITNDINNFLYEKFKPESLFMYPADYLVISAQDSYSKKSNLNAFYPTPSHIVQFMTEVVHDTTPEALEKQKYETVCDPCMGSGIMLLYNSNYSLRLYGNDIDLLMCKLATINAYLYMPWMVFNDNKTSQLLSKMHEKYSNPDVLDFTDEEWEDYKSITLSKEELDFVDRYK